MNSCYFKWVFLLEIFNAKMTINLQDYLLFQHLVLYVDWTSCTVLKSKIHAKSCKRHVKSSCEFKRRSYWRFSRIFLCVYPTVNSYLIAFNTGCLNLPFTSFESRVMLYTTDHSISELSRLALFLKYRNRTTPIWTFVRKCELLFHSKSSYDKIISIYTAALILSIKILQHTTPDG